MALGVCCRVLSPSQTTHWRTQRTARREHHRTAIRTSKRARVVVMWAQTILDPFSFGNFRTATIVRSKGQSRIKCHRRHPIRKNKAKRLFKSEAEIVSERVVKSTHALIRFLVDSNGEAFAFKRTTVEPTRMPPNIYDPTARMPNGKPYPPVCHCQACNNFHPQGSCPLKLAGVELCNICGTAHFGRPRICPHIKSEPMVTNMINAVKQSNEPEHLKGAALT